MLGDEDVDGVDEVSLLDGDEVDGVVELSVLDGVVAVDELPGAADVSEGLEVLGVVGGVALLFIGAALESLLGAVVEGADGELLCAGSDVVDCAYAMPRAPASAAAAATAVMLRVVFI